jgi:hypothetical protein
VAATAVNNILSFIFIMFSVVGFGVGLQCPAASPTDRLLTRFPTEFRSRPTAMAQMTGNGVGGKGANFTRMRAEAFI